MTQNCRRRIFSVIVLIIGLSIALILGEIISRIAYRTRPSEVIYYSKDNPNYVLTRWIGGERGYEFIPNSELYDIKINSLGFRDLEYPSEKGEGIFRVVVLGDSITMGDSMGDAIPITETFPKVLENLLKEKLNREGIEVFNTGISGYNLRQEAALLLEREEELSPDFVVIGFCLNDFSARQHIKKKGEQWEIRFYNEAFPVVIDLKEKWNRMLFEKVYLFRFLNLGLASFYKIIGKPKSFPILDIDEIRGDEGLLKIKEVCKKRGAGLVILIFPYLIEGYTSYETSMEHRRIIDRAREMNIPFIDLYEAYKDIPLSEIRAHPEDTVHPGNKGHRIAGEVLSEYLVEWMKKKGL